MTRAASFFLFSLLEKWRHHRVSRANRPVAEKTADPPKILDDENRKSSPTHTDDEWQGLCAVHAGRERSVYDPRVEQTAYEEFSGGSRLFPPRLVRLLVPPRHAPSVLNSLMAD